MEVWRVEIQSLLEQGKEEEALRRLDAVLAEAPGECFALLERARLRMRHHHVAEALEDLTRLIAERDEALEARADHQAALLYAGQQLLAAGLAIEAATVGRRLPEKTEQLLLRGEAMLALGRLEDARGLLYRSAATLEDSEESPWRSQVLGRVYGLLGEVYARAWQHVEALDCTFDAMSMVGPSYRTTRLVAQVAWQLAGGPAEAARTDVAAKLSEASMSPHSVDGHVVSMVCAELQQVPFLERLRWKETVEKLSLPVGARDSREAFAVLFQLELPMLHHLEIEAEHFGFEELRRLLDAQFFTRLESLRLSCRGLTEAALQLLIERLPSRLRELRVAGGDARPRLPRRSSFVAALRGWSQMRLEVLELRDCKLGAAEAMALAEARLPALTRLDLRGNELAGLDRARWKESELVRQVKQLEL